MTTTLDEQTLVRVLPGTWRIGATNFGMWLKGDRLKPSFTYELKRSEPLVLADTVTYSTVAGAEKTIVGVDRLRADGFVWRGSGLLTPITSRWSVIGISSDASIVALRFSKTLFTAAGVDIIIRDEIVRDGIAGTGTDSHAFRTMVSSESEALGISHGEFASLTWLELPG
jgi:hypothetical protein